jgi:hypothetical protein
MFHTTCCGRRTPPIFLPPPMGGGYEVCPLCGWPTRRRRDAV